jgi:hypothetical protein
MATGFAEEMLVLVGNVPSVWGRLGEEWRRMETRGSGTNHSH